MRDTHLLGIGFKHLGGGEKEFEKSADKVVKHGRRAKDSVSSLEGANRAAQKSFSQYVAPVRGAVAAIVAATTAVAAYVGTVGLAVTLSAQFQSGLVGVGKTANIEGAQLAGLGRQVDELSRRIPVATKSLLEIAQAAGQLGVKGPANILKFTETVGLLGQASDLAGEEAATALARILNVTGESVDEVDRLASVIVALGNNFAATESQIAHHTGEVARATAVYEIGSTEAAAMATTLAAFGVRAELSGSAIGRSFRVIESAVKSGGAELKILAAVARSSADDMVRAWGESPVEAFNQLLLGIRATQAEGGNVAEELAAIGLKGEEVLKVIPVMAKEFETLAHAQNMARTESQQVNALNEEAAKNNATLASQVQVLRNNVESAARIIGDQLLPVVAGIVSETVSWINANRDLIGSVGTGLAVFLDRTATVAKLLADNIFLVVGSLGALKLAGAGAVAGLNPVALAFAAVSAAILVAIKNIDAWERRSDAAIAKATSASAERLNVVKASAAAAASKDFQVITEEMERYSDRVVELEAELPRLLELEEGHATALAQAEQVLRKKDPRLQEYRDRLSDVAAQIQDNESLTKVYNTEINSLGSALSSVETPLDDVAAGLEGAGAAGAVAAEGIRLAKEELAALQLQFDQGTAFQEMIDAGLAQGSDLSLQGEGPDLSIPDATNIPEAGAVAEVAAMIKQMRTDRAAQLKIEQELARLVADGDITAEEAATAGERFASNSSSAAASWADIVSAGRQVLEQMGGMSDEMGIVLDLVFQIASAYGGISGGGGGGGGGGIGGGGGGGDVSSLLGGAGSAAMSYAAIVMAVYSAVDAWAAADQAKKPQGTLAMGGGGLDMLTSRVDEINDALNQAWDQLVAGFRAFEMRTHSSIDQMARLKVEVTGNGDVIATVTDILGASVKKTFSDMNEALEWAQLAVLRGSEISGLTDQMIDVIQATATRDVSLDDVNRALDALVDLETRGFGPVTMAARDLMIKTADLSDLFDGLGVSFGNVLTDSVDQLKEMGQSLLGIQKTEEQKRLDDIKTFNDQILEEQQRVQATIDQIVADIAVATQALAGQTGELADELAAQKGTTDFALIIATLEEKLAGLRQYLADLGDVIVDPADIRRGGGGGRRRRREALEDQLVSIERSGLPEFEQALLELQDRFADISEETRKLGGDMERVAELEAQEIARLKEANVGALIREFLPDGAASELATGVSEFDRQLSDLRDRFKEARAANELLSASEKDLEATRHQLAAAEAEAIRQLNEEIMTSFGLPLDQARAKAKGFRDAIEFLTDQMNEGSVSADRMADFMAQLGAQAEGELFGIAAGILETMGATDQAAQARAAIQQATFHIEIARLNLLYQEYLALGLLTEAVAEQIGDLLGFINDPANWPDFNVIIPPYVPPPAPPSTSGPSDDDRRRQEILDQIAAWNALSEPQNTRRLRDLHETYQGMLADVDRLGISLADFNAAFGVAVDAFWDDVLAPYEDQDLNTAQGQLSSIHETFDELISAAHQYGGDIARIEEARRRAVEQFWDSALQPLRDYQESLLGGAQGGVNPEGRLQAAQARFDDVSQRALAGDLGAIDELPGVIDALLSQARSYYGTGPAYQALLLAVNGVMNQILSQGVPDVTVGGPGSGGPLTPGSGNADIKSGVVLFPPPTAPVADGEYALRERITELTDSMERDRRERREVESDSEARVEQLTDVVAAQSDQIEQLINQVEDLVQLVSDQAVAG